MVAAIAITAACGRIGYDDRIAGTIDAAEIDADPAIPDADPAAPDADPAAPDAGVDAVGVDRLANLDGRRPVGTRARGQLQQNLVEALPRRALTFRLQPPAGFVERQPIAIDELFEPQRRVTLALGLRRRTPAAPPGVPEIEGQPLEYRQEKRRQAAASLETSQDGEIVGDQFQVDIGQEVFGLRG